jgi:hypothetical protein
VNCHVDVFSPGKVTKYKIPISTTSYLSRFGLQQVHKSLRVLDVPCYQVVPFTLRRLTKFEQPSDADAVVVGPITHISEAAKEDGGWAVTMLPDFSFLWRWHLEPAEEVLDASGGPVNNYFSQSGVVAKEGSPLFPFVAQERKNFHESRVTARRVVTRRVSVFLFIWIFSIDTLVIAGLRQFVETETAK